MSQMTVELVVVINLPIKLPLELMQTRWASIINPLLSNQLNGVSILSGINLISGSTVINHLLGKQMSGWFIVDINGAATIYRSKPLNNLTLTLTSNAAVTVDIGVF
jgi:hypothetical protein